MRNLFLQFTITVLLGLLCGMLLINVSDNSPEQIDHRNLTFLKFMDALPFVSVNKVQPRHDLPTFSSTRNNSNIDMERDWPSHYKQPLKNNVCLWLVGKPEKEACDQIATTCEAEHHFNKVNECIMREMNISQKDLRRLSRQKW